MKSSLNLPNGAQDFEKYANEAEEKKQEFAKYLQDKGISELMVEATAALFEEKTLPENPREFLARALYPKIFQDVRALREQVEELKLSLKMANTSK
mmetsp:Transcript_28326/g.39133  ORF Transcript_28326/g.39133 Transcript_28326/m.39133 type:complete len:96 (-) Transcript_28326:46-333(-)|eukprot:CAMPEP_0196584782 /NCGR_PEP_ID=MMETSP1081-20130531/48447_1 /TAXON_ID=36882 /ORGANISM="Pyramimonas amylifera, Strain CCMP720" /LENGTH=95 /DNA_ID=CAMNT_0041906123 /DNA_START=40 /DNA_END=327 /DNA_ORIENTATION=-